MHRISNVYGGFHDTDALNKLINESLVKLDLSTSNIDDNVLRTIASKGCKRLEELHLAHLNDTNCTRQSLEILIPCLKNVKELYLRNADIVDDYTVQLIAENCKDISALNLERCKNITDDSMKHISRLALTRLSISFTSISDVGMKFTEGSTLLNHLEDLSVKCTKVSSVGLSFLNFSRIKYFGFEVQDIQSKQIDQRGSGMCWFHRDIVLA